MRFRQRIRDLVAPADHRQHARVPREHEQFILRVSDVVLGASDPEYVPDQSVAGIEAAVTEHSEGLIRLLRDIAEDRIANPTGDVISKLVTSDEENLTPQELAKFFILLLGAGNETTRNALTHGLHLLSRHPSSVIDCSPTTTTSHRARSKRSCDTPVR
ncbi:putative cytochrome P450 [Mycobacterium xenopi 4042]|uniref:Putative cytochrome P450 n=1 Tax=Mycobacterium xenopi 4042 TaxID=1299334 RepID=X8AHK5_MYCXE|nr:putative cytochrome P450 [Mycobacterium xenopi 4042]